ncbi:helix-turn-helix domain-containing protein [Staphylococcus americanisciuri]|uniref:Helix-turn-helix domain-containing protein n=1 Tax=Staphylococcus americanisciuri TaxID=2973940 RepID=A0ABT2F0Y6_9STAP|nr:helix-turn-helix domain-containing protein [Staphylococcus americanisciuri]MCS4485472.1 helix-turn-helix domain-containing protein [Staphylococcus americanisciuri]
MKSIITFVYQRAIPHKNIKSIYNIIIGKKTHQTFFDATSLQLLSLFGCAPNISYEQFEATVNKPISNHVNIPTSTHVTYPILQQTFVALQLLVQTLSYAHHQQFKFVPLTSQINIHRTVRQLYQHIQQQQAFVEAKEEIKLLFECLNDKHTNSTAHYYLTGYDETMYTQHQVGQITGFDDDALTLSLYIDMFTIYQLLNDSTSYPILHHLITGIPLSPTLNRTYTLLINGHDISRIAQMTQRMENTVQDHVLELFMRNYLTNYTDYFSQEMTDFIYFYMQQPHQRLRFYKSHFDHLSYFDIKLAIIGIAKGALHA